MLIEDMDPDGLFMKFMPPWVRQWAMMNDRSRFKLRKFQVGSVSVWANAVNLGGGGGGGGVNLTNQTFASTDLGNLTTSRCVFQSDGTLVHDDNGTLSDQAAGEWHDDEDTTTGADYEVRYTSASKTGAAYTNPAAAGDTWIRIDADRSWGHRVIAKASPTTASSTATFELGDYLASSADDSATMTISATN